MSTEWINTHTNLGIPLTHVSVAQAITFSFAHQATALKRKKANIESVAAL